MNRILVFFVKFQHAGDIVTGSLEFVFDIVITVNDDDDLNASAGLIDRQIGNRDPGFLEDP